MAGLCGGWERRRKRYEKGNPAALMVGLGVSRWSWVVASMVVVLVFRWLAGLAGGFSVLLEATTQGCQS